MMVVNPFRFGVGPVYEPLVYAATARDGGNRASFTYFLGTISTEDTDRWVIVGIYTNFNAGRSLSAVTINGYSASLMYGAPTLSASAARVEFWKANVPLGTTIVPVVATSSNTMFDGVCGAWVCYREPIFHAGAFDSTISSASFSLNIDVPEGGAVVAMCNNAGGGTSVTAISGVTNDFVDTVYVIAGGSEDLLPAETGRALSITWNSGSTFPDFDGLGAMSVSF